MIEKAFTIMSLIIAAGGPGHCAPAASGDAATSVSLLFEQIGRGERILAAVVQLQQMDPAAKLQVYKDTAESSAGLYRKNRATLQYWVDDLIRSGGSQDDVGRAILQGLADNPEVEQTVQRALTGGEPGRDRAEAEKAVARMARSPSPGYDEIADVMPALRHHPDLAMQHLDVLKKVASGSDQNATHRLWAFQILWNSGEAEYLVNRYPRLDANGQGVFLRALDLLAQEKQYRGLYASEAQERTMLGVLAPEATQGDEPSKQRLAVRLLRTLTNSNSQQIKTDARKTLSEVAEKFAGSDNAKLAVSILAEG